MASRDTQSIAIYTSIGIATAAILAYVLEPNIFEVIDDENKSRNLAVGLSNPGNDCFINSVLQALAGLPKFVTTLDHTASTFTSYEQALNQQDGAHLPEMPDSPVSVALHRLLGVLTSTPSSKRTVSARDFIQTLESVFNARLSRQQQDAHEFLQLVLDRVYEETKHRKHSPLARDDGQSAAVDNTSGDKLRDQTSGKSLLDPEPESKLGQHLEFPFEGQIESIIQCQTCQYKSKSQSNPFLVMTLNVPQDGNATLDACLDGLLKTETIEGYKCAKCCLRYALHDKIQEREKVKDEERQRKLAQMIVNLQNAIEHDSEDLASIEMPKDDLLPRTRISKHSIISKYPKILALHLSRSIFEIGSASRKNSVSIQYPEILRMGGFERRTYKLNCLITHKGGHNSGHYETFRRQHHEAPSEDSNIAETGSGHDQLSQSSTPVLDKNGGDRSRRSTVSTKKLNSKWWRISDDRIAEATTRQVLELKKEAYLLFYELQKD